jgi:diguanylate cyclase
VNDNQSKRILDRYEQSPAGSAELLRLIIPRIREHGGHFSPWAYAVWYEHLAGINPPLTEAIEARLRSTPTVDRMEILAFYGDFIQASEQRTLAQLQAGIVGLLRKLGEIASHSSEGTAEYHRALTEHEQDLAGIVDTKALQGLLEAMKASTTTVRLKTSMLQLEIDAGRQRMESLHEQLNSLKDEAETDPLTLLRNRRGLDNACERLYGSAEASCRGAALVLLDIDHFKQINDGHGHLVGDQVLRVLAGVIASSVKGRDVAVRFGGDEFLVLLPATPIRGAVAVAEDIRTCFGGKVIQAPDTRSGLEQPALSAGVAAAGENETILQLLHRADQALYRAKATGRNRVCIADDDTSRR